MSGQNVVLPNSIDLVRQLYKVLANNIMSIVQHTIFRSIIIPTIVHACALKLDFPERHMGRWTRNNLVWP